MCVCVCRDVYLYVYAGVCICVQVCVDMRGYPLVSFIRSHPASFEIGSPRGQEFPMLSRLFVSLGSSVPHLSNSV